MIALCEETADQLRGVDAEDFLRSKTLQRATERTLELIGEAARQLGEGRPKIDVDWGPIVRLRTMLAHVYHKIDPQILYRTATHDVPILLRKLNAARAGR